MCVLYVFFFKQKTAYEMRISDWSADVCSSDLRIALRDRVARRFAQALRRLRRQGSERQRLALADIGEDALDAAIGEQDRPAARQVAEAQQQLARVPEFFQRFGDDAARVQRRRDGRGVVAGLGAAVEGGRLTRARRAARMPQDDMLVFATRAAARGEEGLRLDRKSVV